MFKQRTLSRRTLGAGALATAVFAAGAASALAGNQKAGWVYRSTQGSGLSFKVSANGKRVVNLVAGYNIKCPPPSGGFGGVGNLTVRSAPISRKGTFRASGTLLFAGAPGHRKKAGTETVTGKFVRGAKASGKVITHMKVGTCHGITISYTAHGSKS